VSTGITEPNANWRETYAVNASLKWVPTDNLTVLPSIFWQSVHINDTAIYWRSLSSPDDNEYNNGNLQRDSGTDPFYLASLKIDWNLPIGDLVSNTSFFHRREHAVTDYTQWVNTLYFDNAFPSPINYVTAYNEDDQTNFAEEFRISSKDAKARLTWTAGIFLSHVSENQPEVVTGPGVAAILGFPNTTIDQSQPNFSMVDKQAAAFGELGVGLFDGLKATLGVRVAHLEYSGVIQQSGPLLGGVVVNSSKSASENPVTPRVVLDYQYSDDSLYYASAAKGYRPGGLNAALPALCTSDLPAPVPPTFQSDSLWEYELGAKQAFMNRTLQVDASIYYLKWKNIQQLVYLACGVGYTPNLGEVEGKGADIDARFRATNDLTLGLTAAYTDDYYAGTVSLTNLGQSVNLVTAGDRMPAQPWNIDANAEYVVNAMILKPYVRVDFQYASGQTGHTQTTDPDNVGSDPTLLLLPTMHVLSLRAGIRTQGLDLSVFAQNVLNYSTPTYWYRDSQYPQDTNYMLRSLEPRIVGLTATYRY
jgi:iron complex outermembrane recepter protein